MNTAEISGLSLADLPPLQRLLLAYAPREERTWQGLCWLLDQRLAAVVRRGGDPMIVAIRLAWWDEVLVAGEREKGRGEPLVERWREQATDDSSRFTEQLIDGWRMLASPDPMSGEDLLVYGKARGGGLFGLLAGAPMAAEPSDAIEQAGLLWALWDLAGHMRDDAFAAQALAVARAQMEPCGLLEGSTAKPLRLARAVAVPDVAAGRIPGGGFTLRHYGRLLRASLRG